MPEPTTRTPTEIFEAVLDAWDDDMKALWSPYHLDEHRAKAAAYREEFSASMRAHTISMGKTYVRPVVPIEQELPAREHQVLGGLRRLMEADANRRYGVSPDATQASRGPVADEVPLSAPEQALADANPSTYVPPEPTASAEEAFQGPGQPPRGASAIPDPELMEALKASLAATPRQKKEG